MKTLWRSTPCAALIGLILLVAWAGQAFAASVTLSWTDSSTDEDGFKVERATDATFAVIATVGADVQGYVDSTVVTGGSYCYRVKAYNSAGESSPSNQACINVPSEDTSSSGSSSGSSGSSSGSGGSTSDPPPSSVPPAPLPGEWSDYHFTVKMKSTDDGSIGVMFRYQDAKNYYRLSWNKKSKFRRLEKRVNGTFKTLIEDAVPYTPGQTYQVEIIAQGTSLEVKVDGSQIFFTLDSSITKGSVALYSASNAGSVYDDILVEDLVNKTTLLWDDFNDSNANGWTIVDEGTKRGPSKWAVSGNTLVQSSHIGSSATAGYLGTYVLIK